MKDKWLAILTSLLLVIQGLLPIYGIFFTFSVYKNIPVLIIEASIFFVLAFFTYVKFHNRFVQWISIIYSLVKGFGGFLGLGWVSAILLAVLFIIGKKKNQLPTQNSSVIPTNTVNSNTTQLQQSTTESSNQL